MGGKIFKIAESGFETVRLTTEEFEPLMKNLIGLTSEYLNTDCETTKYYRTKETGGSTASNPENGSHWKPGGRHCA